MTKAKAMVATNTSMLDKASKEAGFESVMDVIHNFKVYNPRIWEPVDESKANKFKLVEANTKTELYLDWKFTFNPLSVSYFYSWNIFPILDNWDYSQDKVFFSTNEFGKYTKKTDTIWLSAWWKLIWFFTKWEFEEMIKSPQLNGKVNQFFEKKKDKEWKPYNGSLLRKGAVIYWQFVWWDYDQEYFRMFTSMNNIWLTFKDWAVCDPNEWTFEYAVLDWLDSLNELMDANGKRQVTRINPDQCDLSISIRENDKHNFLPVFEFAGCVASRWIDNEESIKYIHDLKAAHFHSIFWAMWDITPILLTWQGNVKVDIMKALPKASTEFDEYPFEDGATIEAEVSKEDLNKLDF